MATSSAKPKRSIRLGWRQLVVVVLSLLGVVSAVVFMAAHWTERQLLTTDNWVTLVAPLPKNEQVATALSEYAVTQAFDAGQVENRIRDGLPDRVTFLAPVLTNQLRERTTNLTKQFVQSDQFESAWTAANRAAHKRLLANARGETTEPPQKIAAISVKLGVVRERIRELLGRADDGTQAGNFGISLGLRETREKISTYVRTIDFVNATLWLFSLVCLLGALIASYSRRRLLVVLGVTLALVGLLQLIGVRALRPTILNQIETSSYRPAVGVIYDHLLANFRNSATGAAIFGFAIAAIAYLSQSNLMTRSKTLAKQLKTLRQSSLWVWCQQLRQTIRRNLLQLAGGVVIIGLLLLAFVLHADWQGVIQTILVMIIAIELLTLAAARSTGSRPM